MIDILKMRGDKPCKILRLIQCGVAIAALSVPFLFAIPSANNLYAAEVPGITEPVSDVTLSATIGGLVSKIFLKEGAMVQKGAVLLEMDQRIDELEVERRKLIWDGKAELEAAAARVKTLKWMVDSNLELFKTTASVSKEELEKLQLDYELAVAEKKKLEAQKERERVEYEMARDSLRKRTILSPIRGTVVKIFLEEGEGFQENQPLVQVVDTSRAIFTANVEEWVGRNLRKGQMVSLKIIAGKSTVLVRGILVFVSPVVDPASGLLQIKAEFNNSDGVVRPGVAGFLLK
jgi:RND family efflux transporter MFP subunit